MVSALIERRLERLEQVSGGDECPRCANTQVIIDCSGNINVVKDQARLTAEASRRFYEEEQPHGQCPACGNFRHKVVVGWGPRQ